MASQQILLGTGAKKYPPVESLFRTYAFTGNSYSETVQMLDNESGSGYTSGDGAAVWHFKTFGNDPYYFDTYNVAGELLIPEGPYSGEFSGWSSSFEGWDTNKHNFYLGNNSGWSSNGGAYSGWIFRKYKEFFDFGEFYKGSGTQTFSHNLEATPYFMMIKRLSSSSDGYLNWMGWHGSEGGTKYMKMDQQDGVVDHDGAWNDTSPTSTQFTMGSGWGSGNYKYWIWPQYGPHINVGFYNGSSSNVSVTTSSDGTNSTAWRPQAINIRRLDSGEPWIWFSTSKGLGTTSQFAKKMNSNGGTTGDYVRLTSTGFTALTGNHMQNGSGNKYMYMAIKEE